MKMSGRSDFLNIQPWHMDILCAYASAKKKKNYNNVSNQEKR